MMLNFKRLETFYWVAKLGSFRKAAEQQYTTQPAISSRIALLEEEIGIRLLIREGNSKVSLTQKGQELIVYAEKMLNLSKEIMHVMTKSSAFGGILRLGVSETIATSWLCIFLRKFHEEAPDVTVELTVDVSINLKQQLENNILDIAFMAGPSGSVQLTDKYLVTVPLVWCGHAEMIGDKKMLSLKELAELPIITYARHTIPYNEISEKFSTLYDSPTRIFTSSSLSICRRLVLDKIAISTLPYEVIKEDVKKGDLVTIDCEWGPSDLNFMACHLLTPFRPELQSTVEMAQSVVKDFAKNSSFVINEAKL